MGWSTLIDEDGKECGIVGDEGWDLASTLLDAFHQLYLTEFGRYATLDEVLQSFEFVYKTSLPEETNGQQLNS